MTFQGEPPQPLFFKEVARWLLVTRRKNETNSLLVAERERDFVLVVVCLLFLTPVFSGDWDAASCQNSTASKIRS